MTLERNCANTQCTVPKIHNPKLFITSVHNRAVHQQMEVDKPVVNIKGTPANKLHTSYQQ